ncbi:hypothetical protein NE865_12001 [Phthorimaea operculella]|nr:hypothetical protein NE865_12001 [Phthorimaea operculella]
MAETKTEPSSSKQRGHYDKKRVVIHRQAREVANLVLEKCIEEKQNQRMTLPLNQAFERASYYTGISKKTLATIQKQAKKGPLFTPSHKGKPINKKNNMIVDDFVRSVLHRTIEEFYLTKNTVPTGPKLMAAIKDKIDFPWTVASFRKLLKAMGYKWVECKNKRRILIEKPAVVYARSMYLRAIRQYRQDERNIFFLDEMWVDHNLTFKKSLRSLSDAVLPDPSSSNRLILVHARSPAQFLNGAKWLFQASTATADQGEMKQNQINFEKWATEVLIPNLPPSSVVVMDTIEAPGHTVKQESNAPTMASTKPAMLEWLAKNEVKASDSMRKDELVRLIKIKNEPTETFKIDDLLKSNGHIVLKLPPYMCDLNPVELAWVKVKSIVKKLNVETKLSLPKLQEVTELAISQVTDEDWRSFDYRVTVLEEEYWERDRLMDDAVDKFVIEGGGDVKAGKEDDDSDQNTDSDESGETIE